jgi:hypothetical protein
MSNLNSIRLGQKLLSTGASMHFIPKNDNYNIDRSLETMHQRVFSALKFQEEDASIQNHETMKLSFLNQIKNTRNARATFTCARLILSISLGSSCTGSRRLR